MMNKKKVNGCKAGFTITDEILKEDKLKSQVLKYISYKKRTESEIRQKFADEDQNILENVIYYFKSQNYINEEDYIERSIREFLNLKNLSIKELTYKLLQKGINKKILDDYVFKNKEMLVKYEIGARTFTVNKLENVNHVWEETEIFQLCLELEKALTPEIISTIVLI